MPLPLLPHHVENAKLYATRFVMLEEILHAMDRPSICEVGVAFGAFSEHMMKHGRPKTFTAIDEFGIHKLPMFWGKPTSEWLGNLTHADFYREKMAPIAAEYDCRLSMMEGQSWDCLSLCRNKSFDLIYLDAGHDEQSVRNDAVAAKDKVRPGGVVVFNDYTIYDTTSGMPYGVVEVANEFVRRNDCKVIGLALQPNMFCDLAVRCP